MTAAVVGLPLTFTTRKRTPARHSHFLLATPYSVPALQVHIEPESAGRSCPETRSPVSVSGYIIAARSYYTYHWNGSAS